MRVARDLKAGMVWVNEWFQSPVQVPHGGVKMSGIGREQGMIALANYTQVKDIAIRIAPERRSAVEFRGVVRATPSCGNVPQRPTATRCPAKPGPAPIPHR